MGYIADSKKRFQQLPSEIKDKLRSVDALNAISDIESEYGIELDILVILVAIGDVSVSDISLYLQEKNKISIGVSEKIKSDLITRVFSLTLDEAEKSEISSGKTDISIDEIRHIFQKDIVTILLEEETDKINKINQVIIGELLNENLLNSKDLVKDIDENQEVVSDTKIIIDDKNVRSTVSNWIRDFIRQEGSSAESFDGMKISRYVTNSVNGRALNSNEKTLVSKLLKLYKKIKFFPESLGNGPADSWQIIPLDASSLSPKARTITPVAESFKQEEGRVNNMDPLESLKLKYKNYRLERKNVLDEEDEILVKTKGDMELIKKELSIAARQNKKNTLVACIKILARQNVLIESLAGSPAWVNALGESIISKYSSRNEGGEISEVVSQLKDNISSPAIISEFLQYLLKTKLKMNENNSALVATDIGQLLGDDYQIMSFGNQSSGSFEWSKINIVNKKLVIDFD